MTDPTYNEARGERRRREHERQALVFGVIIAFLLICGIFALTFYTGALASPFQRDFTVVGVSQQESVPAPCLPEVEGQPDGALPAAHKDVQIHALNASDKQGAANAFKTEFFSRGFTVASMGNIPKGQWLEHSELRFGKDGIVAAYTLAAQFSSIRLVMDDRKGGEVDLLIGGEYDVPLDEDDVEVEPNLPLTNMEDCVPAEEITPVEQILPVEGSAKQEETATQAQG